MEQRVGTVVLRLTGALLCLTALVVLVRPLPALVTFSPWVVGGFLALLTALAWSVFRLDAAHLLRRAAGHRVAPALVGGLGVLLSTAQGWLLQYPFGWDARVVLRIAELVRAGGVSPDGYGYLSLYPNTVPLVAIDRGALEVASWFSVTAVEVMIVVNGLCLAVTLAGVQYVVGQLASRAWGVLAQLLVVGLVGMSAWLAVPYTDLTSMPLLTWGVALAVTARRGDGEPRWVRLAAAGVLLACAYVIKTTPVAAGIAVVLAVALGALSGSGRRRVLALGGAFTVAVAFVVGAAVADRAAWAWSGVDTARVDTTMSPPLVWWMANGMNLAVATDGRASYGAYSRDMVAAIEGADQEQMREYAADYAGGLWDERGVGGMLAFYGNKQAANWGDATFSAWMEGADSLAQLRFDSAAAQFVESWNVPYGPWYQLRAQVAEAVWLLVMLAGGVALLRVPWRRELVVLALVVLGISGFVLLFQGRARYLFAFVPLVVATSCSAFATMRSRRAGSWGCSCGH